MKVLGVINLIFIYNQNKSIKKNNSIFTFSE